MRQAAYVLSLLLLDLLFGGSCFAQQQPAKASAPLPLVVVRLRYGDNERLLPAWVYRAAEGKAYLVAPAGERSKSPFAWNGGKETPVEFTAVWNADGKRQKAELKFRGIQRHLVLEGAAKELPQPVDPKKCPQPAAGDEVRLAGPEIDDATDAFHDAVSEGVVRKLFHNADDRLTRFDLALQPPAPLPMRIGLAVNIRGEVLGIRGLETIDDMRNPPGTIGVARLPETFAWEEPAVHRLFVHPVSGDRKNIVWRVGVQLFDPLNTVRGGTIKVSRAEIGSQSIVTGPALPPAEEHSVALKPGELPDDSRAYLEPDRGSRVIFGEFTEPNLGKRAQGSFAYELALDAGEHKFEPHGPTLVDYRSGNTAGYKPPSILGLNGQPLDLPEAKKVGEAYLLTSEITLDRAPAEAAAPKHPPQPKVSDENLAGETRREGEITIRPLSLDPWSPNRTADRPRPLITYSADGKQLYLVDGKDVLRKIDTQTLVATAELSLENRPTAIQMSRAGLLLTQPNGLWQLDPQTLRVTSEYPLTEIVRLAAAPGSNIAFVLSSDSAPFRPRPSPRVFRMLDLAAGKVTHFLRFRYDDSEFTTPLGPALPRELSHLHLTDDGRYLFAVGPEVYRYRVENGDLLLEETSARSLHQPLFFTVSRFGALVATPAVPDRGGASQGVRLLQGLRLKENALLLKFDGPSQSGGIDPVTGGFYALESEVGVRVFSQAGAPQTVIRTLGRDVREIRVDPRGGRFLVAGDRQVSIVEFPAP